MPASKYIGQPCTSCRNTFKEGDDVVVCPVCGSPYHKDCYKLEGKCVNTLLHESGSEWHPEPVVVPGAVSEDRICPNCGTHNAAEASFCIECGRSLSGENRYPDTDIVYNQTRQAAQDTQQMPFGMPPFINVETVTADTEVDGNTVGEYTKYVGSKYYYYIPKFLRFARGNKISFSIPAFFIPQLWFFYRKMPVHGVITMILSVLTGIPTILEYAGINDVNMSAGFAGISLLCSLLSWVITMVCALFGNYMYYLKAKSDIDRIKAATPDTVRRNYLIEAGGGTSMAYVVISIVIVFVLSMFISAFLLVPLQMM